MESDFSGESRYGKKYFHVKTDKNGFRINHLIDNQENSQSILGDKIFFFGDSFTFGIGLDWEKSFVGILNKDFKINAVNAGVNSYSPTTYKYKLKSMIDQGLISKNQKIVIGLDISDVFDEATRWTEYKGKPANIQEVKKLNKKNSTESLRTNNLSFNNKNSTNFYTKYNFKLTHQIYFGLETFVKSFVDDIQVRNNDRSKFTHKDWELIDEKFLPLGIEQGMKKIKNNLMEISKLSSKNNNELYLLIYPWPAQLAYESLFDWPQYVEELCIEIACAGVINTFPDFLTYKKNSKSWQNELYIRGDMHFNQKGNFVLAEIIANQLHNK
ncbi:hypothetical protein [Prochlorococcus marinus]|uniref:hypothetical protein n=1 Tax=Prochlorococcus marinus TaxID=1219 RepID=UPI001AD990C9|nr:hypothetical protein [Prochlorococcus marinus]MBO8205104.1 hypothetical protein [Prochlorococcus marinus CUG1415]